MKREGESITFGAASATGRASLCARDTGIAAEVLSAEDFTAWRAAVRGSICSRAAEALQTAH